MASQRERAVNSMLGMSEEEVEALAEAYESDDIEFDSHDEVRQGSPMDYVGTRRATFIMDAADDCKMSDIYRTALREYLARRNLAHA